MASIYPHEPSIDAPVADTTTATLGGDTADTIIGALSSETARGILRRLHTDPAPASDLAADLNTSLQNVQYHLGKLKAAELIQEAGTWYSSRGREMPVYAPTINRVNLTL